MTLSNFPKLYLKNETDFEHNGLGVLKDCSKAIVTEERNGTFELEMEYISTSRLGKILDKEMLIKANASEKLRNQLFRIYDIKKKNDNKILIYARHISFDLLYDIIENVNLENASCEYALNEIFRNSVFSKDYRGKSNIQNSQNYKISYVNCLNAIAGSEGSIIDTFGNGAEILRDNKIISVLSSRGYDNNYLIAYKKNIIGLEVDEDTTDLVTRIYPYAKKRENDNQETIISLPEKFIDSEKINLYQHPYISFVDYTDKFKEDDEITIEKLRSLSKNYFKENSDIDVPKCNYTIDFIHLSKTIEYKNYKMLEQIDLCDKILVRDSRYGIDTNAKVVKLTFDVLSDRIEKIELGQPKTKLDNILGDGNSPGINGDSPNQPSTPPYVQEGDFPDSLPNVPVVTAEGLFATVALEWTFENKTYYNYEIYASQTKDFVPGDLDLIYKGKASSFLHEVKPKQTWYYKARAGNTHGNFTEFSKQINAETCKISDAAEYFEEAAIGHAIIGSLNADKIVAGRVKGTYIDAKNLTVTDGNGKRTLDIDSWGNVKIDANEIKINSGDVASKTDINISENGIKETITNVEKGLKTEISKVAGEVSSKVSRDDVKTIITQSPDQVKIAFNNGSNYVELIEDGIKTVHSDGSYSMMGKNGIKHHSGSTSKDYHYLTYVVGFTTTSDSNSLITVQLPDEFKNKNFSAYATLSDTWEDSWDWGEPWVIQRMVAFVKGGETDYANARVKIQGYRCDKNYETGAYRYRAIAGMLIVIA